MIKLKCFIFILVPCFVFGLEPTPVPELDQAKITQQALMSYDIVRNKARKIGKELELLTFGKHTKKLLLLSPLIDGRWKFKFKDFKFSLNTRKEKGSVMYVKSF